jgi:hypothetical protein
MSVNTLTMEINFSVNSIMRTAYRIEHGRTGGDFMTRYHQVIENGIRTWIAEETLEAVHFELYDPTSNLAYEKGRISLQYTADPREEAVKPPIEELESFFTRLEKLPPDAKFRLVVTTAPNATKIPAWTSTNLLDLKGGQKEKVDFGSHGFGRIEGKLQYEISNWSGHNL